MHELTGPNGTGSTEEGQRETPSASSNPPIRKTRRWFLETLGTLATGAALGGVVSGSQVGDERTLNHQHGRRGPIGVGPGVDGFAGGSAGSRAGDGKGLQAQMRTLDETWQHSFEEQPLLFGPLQPGSTASDTLVVYLPAGMEDTGRVVGLDRDSGSERWSTQAPASPGSLNPGKAVYYGVGSTAEIVALDLADGSERWRTETSLAVPGEIVGLSPTYVPGDGTVYAYGTGPAVAALDATDGSEQWTANVGRGARPVTFNGQGESHVAVGSGTPDGENLLAVFEKGAGSVAWTEMPAKDTATNMVFDDGTLYYGVGGTDGGESDLVAFDAATGTVQWTDTRPDVPWFVLQVHDSTLYGHAASRPETGTSGGAVVKFDDAGNRVWEYEADEVLSIAWVTGDFAYTATASGAIVAVGTADGTERWSTTIDSLASFFVLGGVVYAGTETDPAVVHAVHATTGEKLDSHRLAAGTLGEIVGLEDRLWVSTHPPIRSGSLDSNSNVFELTTIAVSDEDGLEDGGGGSGGDGGGNSGGGGGDGSGGDGGDGSGGDGGDGTQSTSSDGGTEATGDTASTTTSSGGEDGATSDDDGGTDSGVFGVGDDAGSGGATGGRETTSGSGPGFGIVSALSALGGAGYLLRQRLGEDE